MKKTRTNRSLLIAVISITVLGMALSACTENGPAIQTSRTGATEVTSPVHFPQNSQGHTAEQQNILDRLAVTNDPTKVMWIHLISLDGKIINRMPVAHKVTSSGKRLEPLQAGACYTAQGKAGLPEFNGLCTTEFLEADGTFGSSDNYIYWFDPMHRYHQWGTAGGLGYLLTDYPIDLTNPQDRITGMYNADKAAVDWQALQEQKMCADSGKTYSKPSADGAGGKCQ